MWKGKPERPPVSELQRNSPGKVRFAVKELAAYALHGVMTPLPLRASPGEGPPVLFIHGHGGSPGAFAFLRRSLARRGFGRFAAWTYRARGSMHEAAHDLGAFAAGLGQGIHVVAHSLGGIIARYWLQILDGRARAASFATLSSPHRGLTPLPGMSLIPLVREAMHDSELMAELQRTEVVLAGLPCLSVVSTRDHFVRPFTHAAFHPARLVPVSNVGHVGVLFSHEVHGHVAQHLERASGEF